MSACTNRDKLLACIKCPGSVCCPEYAGTDKKSNLKLNPPKMRADRTKPVSYNL